MSKITLQGDVSGTGTLTIAAPNTNTNRTLNLPDAAGNVVLDSATQTLTNKTLGSGTVAGASLLTSATAQASTSGTVIDFTGIPSWAKRITVMFSGVSTNGTSVPIAQLGTSGGLQTSSYAGAGSNITHAAISTVANFTTGCALAGGVDANTVLRGVLVVTNISGNSWVMAGSGSFSNGAVGNTFSSNVTLSGALDRLRITTVNGTDTFDAGTINIMWE